MASGADKNAKCSVGVYEIQKLEQIRFKEVKKRLGRKRQKRLLSNGIRKKLY